MVDALGELRQVYDAAPANPFHAAWLAHAYARAGDEDRARALLNDLAGESKKRFIPAVPMAVVYLGLGDLDVAMEWLERAYAERSQALTFLNSEPIYDPLRSNPRFQELRRRVGFTTDEPSR